MLLNVMITDYRAHTAVLCVLLCYLVSISM